MEQQPPYVEDGAGAEERDWEEERDAAEHRAGRNGAPPAVTKWTWMALAAAGVAAAGGLILAYCLYRRIRHLENVSTQVSKGLANTQEFTAEMAQRLKWPWPLNNRIWGLEEEYGLPKK